MGAAIGDNNLHATVRYALGLLDFFEVLAIQKWFGASVVGFALALSTNYHLLSYSVLGFLIGMPLVLSYVMSINDCFDVEIDKMKEKYTGKKRIVSSVISKRMGLFLSCAVLLIGLFSALFVSIGFFVIVLLIAFLGTIYSVPPFRLKMKYPYSTLLMLIGDFLPFIGGYVAILPIDWRIIAISSSFGFLALTYRFKHEIEHYKVDFESGKRTVAVVHSVETARMLSKTCMFIGITEIILFFSLGWFPLNLLFLLCPYFFLCVEWFWVNHLPKPLKTIVFPMQGGAGFILFLIIFIVYGNVMV